MKSEQEIRYAMERLRHFIVRVQGTPLQSLPVSVIAALEWVLDEDTNEWPVETLKGLLEGSTDPQRN